MSKRVILTLASAAVLSAALPGMAGYVTAQFQALDRAHEELSRLRAQLRMMELTVRPAAAECPDAPSTGRRQAENGMHVPTPPRTDSRSWQDAAYEQPVEAPAAWTSLVGPGLVTGPAPQRPPSRGRDEPGCPIAGAYLAQLGFGAPADSNCRER